jgi:hypothetical protein
LQLKKEIKTIFSKDLAAFTTVMANNVRGGNNSGPFALVNILNNDVWSFLLGGDSGTRDTVGRDSGT